MQNLFDRTRSHMGGEKPRRPQFVRIAAVLGLATGQIDEPCLSFNRNGGFAARPRTIIERRQLGQAQSLLRVGMARTNKWLAQNNKTNLLAQMYMDHVGSRLLPNGGCDGPQPFILKEGNPLMLKYYVEAVKRLSTDKDGVVSFEYVIVAACIVAAVVCCVRYWC